MPSIKRNSRTNLILDHKEKGCKGRKVEAGKTAGGRGGGVGGRGRGMKWETFVRNRADQNFTVGICRCPGDRATRSGGVAIA